MLQGNIMTGFLEQALEYKVKYGFNVFPCGKDKKPLVETWLPYQTEKVEDRQIIEWWEKNPEANIAVVTGNISNLAVIDIDSKEGETCLLEKFPEIDLVNNPVVDTPRGGKHIYFQCQDEELRNGVNTIKGCDFRANGGYVVAPPSISGTGKQYVWKNPLTANRNILPSSYALYIKSSNSYKQNVTQNVTLFQKGTRDNDVFHTGHQLKKAGSSNEEIRQTMYLIGRSCNPPLQDAEIEIKYQSVIKFNERKDMNITEFVENWISQTDGAFTIVECNKSVTQCNIASQNTNLRMIFKRLKEKGFISKFGEKDGYYVRVDDKADDIDWLTAPTDPINVVYPLGIELLFQTYPKNIIVIAGVPDAGKTAFLLNFVRMNMDLFDIHYFSSEMGAMEFKNRLSKFRGINLEDWKFKAKERCIDFHNVIQPNAINIIDFLEMSDNFYKISGYFQEIHNKLQKGIAIIAIQKNPGTEVGLGGYRGMEKPRLYLNMDRGKIKITKAKNWRTDICPSGLCLDFKIVQGCEFIVSNDWYKEGGK